MTEPKPSMTYRELAERILDYVHWDTESGMHFKAGDADRAVVLIDLFVKVKEAETRFEEARWWRQNTGKEHAYIRGVETAHKDEELSARLVAAESSLSAARAELEKSVP